MSDTPRTDRLEFHIGSSGPYVWAHEMREWEREIVELQARVAEYESYRCEPAVKADDKPWDVLHKQIRLLQAMVDDLETKYGHKP